MSKTSPLCDPWLMRLASFALDSYLEQGRGLVFIDDDQWTKPELKQLNVRFIAQAEIQRVQAQFGFPYHPLAVIEMAKGVSAYDPLQQYVLCFYGDRLKSVELVSFPHKSMTQVAQLIKDAEADLLKL